MQSITKNPPSNSASQSWPCPSHIEVLLRNLRLLHLDRRPDWPRITVKSFYPSQQNLRTRVKTVEWTLYHLLLIWDPEETQNKLDPYFPPADQLQSSNLRAAIFKIFSELKKNGALGRDFNMRKSMFDDCKGEKFEELLAIFSTAVLHAWLDRNSDHIAETPILALARGRNVSHPEYTLPMVISLRHALERHAKGSQGLKSNEASKRAVELLEQHERHIDASLQGFVESPQPSLNKGEPLYQETHEKILNSWQGDQAWVDAILEGGSRKASHGLLELGFPEASRLLKQRNNLNDASIQSNLHPDADPLSSLENRVAEQRSRLKLWKDFRDTLSNEKSRNSAFRHRTYTSHHIFQKHQELSASGLSGNLDPYATDHIVPAKPEHAKVIEAMDAALLTLKQESPKGRGHRTRFDAVQSSGHAPDERYEVRSLQSSKSGKDVSPSRDPASPTTLPPSGNTMDSHNNSGPTSPEVRRDAQPLSPDFRSTPRRAFSLDATRGIENAHLMSTPFDLSPASPDTNTNTNTRHLNLTERTKQSMSYFSQQPLPPASPEPHEETRSPRARHALLTPDAYRTPRALDSQSPTYNFNDGAGKLISGRSTPREELFDQEADYARVFKSRPKVALSPVRPPLPIFRDNRRIEDMLEGDCEGPSTLDDAMIF